MSNVTLNIAGREYAVACAEGEEDHVRKLGLLIDGKVDGMGSTGSHSETRTLLFAALLLADEVHDLKANGGSAAHPAAPSPQDSRLDEKLEALAVRLEACAGALEQ